MQRSEHDDRSDRRAGKLWRDILGKAGQAQPVDVGYLPGDRGGFQIFTAVMSQAEVQALSNHRLLDHVGMPVELVADCGTDEVGAVRVEPVLHHQVDVAEVDIAEIDRNFLAVAPLGPQLMYSADHP